MSRDATGPLAGTRVLDLTSVVLGPLATRILGDWGAEVVKVEPLAGDLVRDNGVAPVPGLGSIFLALNRNKRSIALDPASPDGAAVLRRLAAEADVLVHNMRVAAIERMGLGYAAVAALNPRIVYCAATGFGQDGPHAGRPAFDDVVQAACGLVDLGRRSADDPPDYVHGLVADKTAGLMVANAVLAALLARERTGRGQQVEVPMLETMVDFTLAEHLGGLAFEPPRGPAGYGRILGEGGRRPQRTRDGWIAVLPYTARHWRALLAETGRQDWPEAAGLDDPAQRSRASQALYARLGEIMPERGTAEWLATLERLDIPASPIVALHELPAHPHLSAVGLFQTAEHPDAGTIRYVRPTVRFAATPAAVERLAPRLGQHTTEILAELGFDDDEIAAMAGRGAIVPGDR